MISDPRMNPALKEAVLRAGRIKMALFDVDGVMTDGSLFLGDDGQEYKAFHSLDGHGLKMLKQSGVDIGIITGRSSNVVKYRAENLGIEHIFQGVENKGEVFLEFLSEKNLTPEQASYMGDDVVDLPVLTRCGFAVSVPEAPNVVKKHCHYITAAGGGRGAVREFCEFILYAQNHMDEMIESYLK